MSRCLFSKLINFFFKTSTEKDVLLSEMVCAQIIHDMAGNVGSAASGMDMLINSFDGKNNNKKGENHKEFIWIAENSILCLKTKVQLFRVAFGQIKKNMKAESIDSLIQEYVKASSRIKQFQLTYYDEEIEPLFCKLIACLTMIIERTFEEINEINANISSKSGALVLVISGSCSEKKIKEIKEMHNSKMPTVVYISKILSNFKKMIIETKDSQETTITIK